MHIEQIRIQNFRILKDCTLDMRKQTTVLVGKNNTGKTSFAVLLEKFLVKKKQNFTFDDFPLCLRSKLTSIEEDTDVNDFSIRAILKISYEEDDDLSEISDFMLDLDPNRRHVNILMECEIDKAKILKYAPSEPIAKKIFIEKNLGNAFCTVRYSAFNNVGTDGEIPFENLAKEQFAPKELQDVLALVNLQVIHAKRHVASSDETGSFSNPLSIISNQFFSRIKKSAESDSEPETSQQKEKEKVFEDLKHKLADIDKDLGPQYEKVFDSFLNRSKEFLDLNGLKVVSDIQSQSLIKNSSKVIFGDEKSHLPENYSGLGYLNVLYLLLQIEFISEEFRSRKTPIKLLIIEEPEAHTHPQMQYVFAEKIESLIEDISNLQAILTTHSSHIITKSKFEDLRYLKSEESSNGVVLKNFHTELSAIYEKLGDDGKTLFKFLKQYLTLYSAELFFANKVIFIEGVSERILLPWFIREFDKTLTDDQLKLSSQNVSVMEVGANSQAFAPFLDFIGIKTLIITDIDTTKYSPPKDGQRAKYEAHRVKGSSHTSNHSISYFLNAPEVQADLYKDWHKKLISGTLKSEVGHLKLAYQLEEDGYHARSFEDAFISINLAELSNFADDLRGLKYVEKIKSPAEGPDFYELTNDVLGKKSDFAASLLYLILVQEAEAEVEQLEWRVPKYIIDGLSWLHQE